MGESSESPSEWPETRTGDRGAPKWNIKTEDEEYLERLEDKLARLQREGPKPKHATRRTSSDISSLSGEEDDDERANDHPDHEQALTKEDDPGLHLLHDVERQTQPHESLALQEPSTDRAPSPENALHLRLGEESRQTSESSSRSGLQSNDSPNRADSSNSAPGSVPPSEEIVKSRPFPFRVRFRSRVRIASGLRHHKSRSSLGSSSPSSSISAPLRYSSYEGEPDTTYAQLISDVASGISGGRQLSSQQSNTAYNPYGTGKKFRRYGSAPAAAVVDERTPLFAAAPDAANNGYYGHKRRPSLSQIPNSDAEDDDQSQRDAHLRRNLQQAPRKSEEEVMFGKWPWRLLNGHWWLWKLDPICGCCYTDDESDSDLD